MVRYILFRIPQHVRDSLYGAHKATEPNPHLSPRDVQDFIAEPLSSYFTYGTLRISETYGGV